jgi:hypothetical protein
LTAKNARRQRTKIIPCFARRAVDLPVRAVDQLPLVGERRGRRRPAEAHAARDIAAESSFARTRRRA